MGMALRMTLERTLRMYVLCVNTNYVDIDIKDYNKIKSLIMNFTWKWRDLLTLSNNNNVIQNGCLII